VVFFGFGAAAVGEEEEARGAAFYIVEMADDGNKGLVHRPPRAAVVFEINYCTVKPHLKLITHVFIHNLLFFSPQRF